MLQSIDIPRHRIGKKYIKLLQMTRFNDPASSRLSSKFLLLLAANVSAFLLTASFFLIFLEQIGNHPDSAKTSVAVITASLMVILGNIGFTVFFFRRYVRKPLRKIIQSIAAADGVGGMVDSSAHNMAGDEWAVIEYALRSMQSELSSQLAAIRNSEARYKLLVENQGDMIVKLDSEGHFQFASPTYCETFGKSQAELLGSVSPITLLAKGQGERGRTMMDLYRPPYECLLEQRSLTTKGWRWFSWNHRALLDERGQVSAIIGVGRDVTDRKQAEMELDRQRSFLHTVIDAVADPILVIGRDYRIKMSNAAALKSFGSSDGSDPKDLTGFCYKATHGENAPCKDAGHPCPLHQVLQTGQAVTALHLHNTTEGERTFELTANPFTDSEGRILGIVQVSRDITEKLKAEDRIRFLAHHDALTGLPNRVLLRDRFVQAANYADRAGHSVAVLFLDLDHFKDVNDSLGHKVGDRLLQEVVVRLSAKVRSSDTVSRLGGDEFVVVVPQAGVQGTSEQIAGHILKALSEPFYIDGHNLRLSASIGISLYPMDGDEFDDLLKSADTAMYSAKEGGRNTYRYYSKEMNQVNTSRLHTLSLMKQALENEEFNLFYQPQVEMATGRIVGLEALVSWNTHDLGRLRPGQFISLAEESGLIVPLGDWVLHQACRQVSNWNREFGCSIPIAVNLSALQIRQQNLTDSVLAALEQSGLSAGLLDLELTESMLLQDTSQVLKTVVSLKSLGVNLIMDDFGTGYSSLSYLKKFNLSGLKIDRSFIVDLIHESEDAAIVRAIIQMSRSLGLSVVAEGVESTDQAAWLKREGCERAQGYYYYKPMDAQNLTGVLSSLQAGALLAMEN
ncbi:MAG: EAL domain-containing protein [Chromatiaceae bacterium]|nr:EAL domain-containing protein [Chromatiaceae bacterium]